jgi:UDP-N-acetylmuramate dehydrogenase
LIEASSEQELREALAWSREAGVPPLVLGGGSNMLVADAGWPGVVIRVALEGIHYEPDGDSVCVIAGGGVEWDHLVRESVEENLQGIECLSGIPGTVGASPVQNIGAYGQEVKDTIEWVEALDRASGEVLRIPAVQCGFAYRWSRFKGEDKDRFVVTRVAFRLRKNGSPELRYGDLTRYFAEKKNTTPTLAQVREAVIEVRAGKGMVISPDIPDSRSCGSFFMNPIVPEAVADRAWEVALAQGLASADHPMPRYPASAGHVKLSAAWLMEKSGLKKGEALGNVGLSSRHVLAIVNRDGGTASEVLTLVARVQNCVKERFDIDLLPEPVFVGFDQPC